MKIITAEGNVYEINEDGLNPIDPIEIQVAIGIPGTNEFSKSFPAQYDPGAVGNASIVLPMSFLEELGWTNKLPLLNVSESEMADGSTAENMETLISLRIHTIPHNRPIVFEGIRCSVLKDANSALIGMSVWRYFDSVMQGAELQLLSLANKLT